MNIAEILKYCPKGTKLYSNIFGEVTLDKIDINEKFPIIAHKCDGRTTSFTEEGCYVNYPDSECVIFPSKGQRDWNKFRLPVKKGDIMMKSDGDSPFIATGELYSDISPKYICGINSIDEFKISYGEGGWTSEFYILASEEAKKKLFDKMAEAGYKWNANTLKLEKIESKFKEGDVVSSKKGDLYLVLNTNNSTVHLLTLLYKNGNFIAYNTFSMTSEDLTIATEEERNKFYSALVREGYKYDKWQHKLVKQEFKPFDKVLARDNETESWNADIYLEYLDDTYLRYRCACSNYRMCIPYEGNEYLLDTTDFSE